RYFSATSARPPPAPLLFQQITLCHSVFSCFSPPLPFHCLLVATDNVATREPLFVLRTSGSAPTFPIRMSLLRLRLTTTCGDQRGLCFGDEKERKRDAVAEVLRGPRIAEHLLLDRVHRGYVAELSGTNWEEGGRDGSPISPAPRRAARRRARRRPHRPARGPRRRIGRA